MFYSSPYNYDVMGVKVHAYALGMGAPINHKSTSMFFCKTTSKHNIM